MRWLVCVLACWAVPAGGQPAASEPEAPSAATVLVAHYSETGNTEALGRALAEGVGSVDGVESVLRKIGEVTDEEILAADGIVVGTPVYWGSLSARVKDFLDRVGRVLDSEVHGEGRTAGAFCTGGAESSGKELARLAILAAFANMRFTLVGGVQLDGYGTLGAAATTGPSDPGLSEDELETARRSGERFARITADLLAGRRARGAP